MATYCTSTRSTPNTSGLLQRLQQIVDCSPYTVAARACGFTFDRVTYYGPAYDHLDGVIVRMGFQCICGRKEYFMQSIDAPHYDGGHDCYLPDLAERLYSHGSFGRDHLLRDGYDAAFADRTERMFKAVLDAVRPFARAA